MRFGLLLLAICTLNPLVFGQSCTVDHSVTNLSCDGPLGYCWTMSASQYVQSPIGTGYSGEVRLNVYGTCNGSQLQVHAEAGVDWLFCQAPVTGYAEGTRSTVTRIEGSWTVIYGYVDSYATAYYNGGASLYGSRQRQYCDGSDPVNYRDPLSGC
jgi:hypothetical protein